jgi:hypothetical protein
MEGDYRRMSALEAQENKPNSSQFAGEAEWIPAFAGMTDVESLNNGRFKGYLKKQTQFAKEQIDVKCYLERVYTNIFAIGARKNKANSKPIFRLTCGGGLLD